MQKVPKKLKLYLGFIYLITIASLCYFGINGFLYIPTIDYKGILVFIILTAATESFVVVIKGISVSTGFAVTLASYILFGSTITIIITIIGFTFRIFKVDGKNRHLLNTPFYKTLFNYCTFILLITYSDYLYVSLGGRHIFETGTGVAFYFPQLLIFTLSYVILNNIIISILVTCISGNGFFSTFVSNMKLVLLSNMMMAPFGLILAYVYNMSSHFGIIAFLCPILLARFTFSLYADSKEKYVQTIDALTRAIEARDKYTEGHSKRVADISDSIAKEMKCSDWKREQLKIAALMHDVGKIGIDDAILNKPEKLTDEEYKVIKKHPVIGYNILKDVKDLVPILDIVKYHHERYDGKGYPERKTADELGIDVFIVQLADAIDAMSTDRPYRKALSEDEVINELIRCSGTQFHPKVVDAYLKTKGIDMKALIEEKEKEEAEIKGDRICL